MSERVTIRRHPDLPGVTLLQARYRHQVFAPHAHDTYVVGVDVDSAHAFTYRRQRHVAVPGQVAILNPGEAHTGVRTSTTDWTYFGLYPPAELLAALWRDMDGRSTATPSFSSPLADDPELARRFVQVHRATDGDGGGHLAEALLVEALGLLVARHADPPPRQPRVGAEPAAVRRARDLVEAAYHRALSLADLAEAAALSRWHLIRVFRSVLGLTPHEYLVQVRVERARALLLRGTAPAEVAVRTGFTDQSHLTRNFRRLVGTTPARFQRQLLAHGDRKREREEARRGASPDHDLFPCVTCGCGTTPEARTSLGRGRPSQTSRIPRTRSISCWGV